MKREARTHDSRFGNRLAEGITIGCSSLSALIPAEEQISAFCIYLQVPLLQRTG